ncbi:hypothetical protein BDN72DRAFT_842273 [Pluteus cervinus]|uniref:Uncharacterized protein n=1 Tax=Pluteus cervinus TaxID=181527 RepID=A0ACD3AQJ6_9AGAR|nr:hypothetical protein BDN72DRAFT_842273 [Pluteus cervinus]
MTWTSFLSNAFNILAPYSTSTVNPASLPSTSGDAMLTLNCLLLGYSDSDTANFTIKVGLNSTVLDLRKAISAKRWYGEYRAETFIYFPQDLPLSHTNLGRAAFSYVSSTAPTADTATLSNLFPGEIDEQLMHILVMSSQPLNRIEDPPEEDQWHSFYALWRMAQFLCTVAHGPH